jgi:L-fuculose-phosphate aldolase
MTGSGSEQELRQTIVEAQRKLVSRGLTSGTSGNVSVRLAHDEMLITPTGVAPDELRPEHIVRARLDGSPAAGQLTPSSEWRIHADVYRDKPTVGAVVHCHSTYATMLACAHRPIPAVHYMLAASGRCDVPLADYATFGTAELSRSVLAALADARVCLMANHGQLATGATLDHAFRLAELVEEVAHWYWGVLAMGDTPRLLGPVEIEEALAAFAGYGQQASRPDLAAGNTLSRPASDQKKRG